MADTAVSVHYKGASNLTLDSFLVYFFRIFAGRLDVGQKLAVDYDCRGAQTTSYMYRKTLEFLGIGYNSPYNADVLHKAGKVTQ